MHSSSSNSEPNHHRQADSVHLMRSSWGISTQTCSKRRCAAEALSVLTGCDYRNHLHLHAQQGMCYSAAVIGVLHVHRLCA
jgi:hypothetical protein